MPKKSRLLESLKKYLKETPPEKLKKDFEELEPYNEIGPDVEEYMEYIRKLHKNV